MQKSEAEKWIQSLNWQPVSGQEFGKLTDDQKLIRIRHSASHILASALKKLWPDMVFATGPATAEGYFYDIRSSHSLSLDDLPKIQEEMDKVANAKLPFEFTEVPREKALEYFEAEGQTLKLEVMRKIPSPTLTLYRHGDFVDLCAGPHVPNTGSCKASKVLGIAAAHWKKDEKIPSLTRVSGTAWHNPKELRQYLELVEEIKKRDHRVLGPQLELFFFHDWAGGAMWQPNGLTIRSELMNLWRKTISRAEYVEIMNPILYRKDLFVTSGHWEHYREDMFIIRDQETHEPHFCLKPMNCPDTMLYFKSKRRSYRDLPMRVAEGQILHRDEASGAIHGIMRTRNFVQDDAHIFVTADQIQGEVANLMKMLESTYTIFGLRYEAFLSTRPETFLGEKATWDQAEDALKKALESTGMPFKINPGDGAFYGPKIDIVVNDSLGRNWQCGTMQLDYQLPERFELEYSAEDMSLKRPIVIHRAIFGSFERFIGILIEHFGGAFPTWLAPVQAALLPISEKHLDYMQDLRGRMIEAGFRVDVMSDDSINKRMRTAQMSKIPYILVAGDREAAEGTISVRRYGQQAQKVMKVEDLLSELHDSVTRRKLDVEVKDYAEFFRAKRHISTEGEEY